MAQLLVRNLDDEIVTLLKLRAAQNQRSAEAEHREILREVLLERPGRPDFKELLASMPDVGTDEDFERIPDIGREVDL